MNHISESRNPSRPKSKGLDCSRFARHYSGNLLLDFYCLKVLRCFNSLRLLPKTTSLVLGLLDFTPAEFPHSDTSGSTLVWQLTGIFRSLHRPSSPACPKASTLCPKSLIASSSSPILKILNQFPSSFFRRIFVFFSHTLQSLGSIYSASTFTTVFSAIENDPAHEFLFPTLKITPLETSFAFSFFDLIVTKLSLRNRLCWSILTKSKSPCSCL